MGNEEQNYNTFIYIGIAFVAVICAISSVTAYFNKQNETTEITNKNEITSELNDEDLKKINAAVHKVLETAYNIAEDEKINATIRQSSLNEGKNGNHYYANYILDIDSHKISYQINYSRNEEEKSYYTLANCLDPRDSKYPDTFCIGSEFNSTIDHTIIKNLPYEHRVDGKLQYKLVKEGMEPKLRLYTTANCHDTETQNKQVENAKEWIKKMGAPADIIPIEIDERDCKYRPE